MAELRDPRALVRHAAATGDLALAGLVSDRLGRDAGQGPRSASAAWAYMILVCELRLTTPPADESSDGR